MYNIHCTCNEEDTTSQLSDIRRFCTEMGSTEQKNQMKGGEGLYVSI